MTKVEICRMCLEYSADMTCEHIRECKLMKVLDENKRLKEKLEEENKVLKDFIRQIDDTFKMFNGKTQTTDEIIRDIIDILRVYHDVFKEEAP